MQRNVGVVRKGLEVVRFAVVVSAKACAVPTNVAAAFFVRGEEARSVAHSGEDCLLNGVFVDEVGFRLFRACCSVRS